MTGGCPRSVEEVLGLVLSRLRSLSGVLALDVLTPSDREVLLRLESQDEDAGFLGFKRFNEGLREALSREHAIALAYRSSIFPMPHKPPVKLLYRGRVIGELLYSGDKPSYSGRYVEIFKGFHLYLDLLPRRPSERRLVRLVYLTRVPGFLTDVSWVDKPIYGEPSPRGHRYLVRRLRVGFKPADLATGVVGFNLRSL